jgi:hypothetical protein
MIVVESIIINMFTLLVFFNTNSGSILIEKNILSDSVKNKTTLLIQNDITYNIEEIVNRRNATRFIEIGQDTIIDYFKIIEIEFNNKKDIFGRKYCYIEIEQITPDIVIYDNSIFKNNKDSYTIVSTIEKYPLKLPYKKIKKNKIYKLIIIKKHIKDTQYYDKEKDENGIIIIPNWSEIEEYVSSPNIIETYYKKIK